MSIEPPHMPDEDDHEGESSRRYPLRDDQAFANELESLRPNGIRVATPILDNKYEAEDIVDAEIAKLFDKGIPEGAPHEPWFIRCVQNAAKSRVLSASWRNAQDNTILAKVRSEIESPLEQALKNQRVETIKESLLHLSSDDREILRLRFFEDMKIEDIAQHFHLPTNTLYSRLQRAVKRLAKILKKGGKINV